MRSPIISIIIPHFERAELLEETLSSIDKQSCSYWEAIVVDDGSAEATFQKVASFANDKVRVLRREAGVKGPSFCRNLGIEAARGEYILFVDSDDLLARHCVDQRLHETANSPNVDLWVYPVELFRHSPGDIREAWNDMRRGKFSDPLRRFLVSDSPWCVSSTLWRRDVLRELGGFNDRVMYGDDSDLHVRALLSKCSYVEYPEAVPDVYIRRSETARITNSSGRQLLASRRVRLEEGTRTLDKYQANNELRELWEGQYFVEGEFLMFTQAGSQSDILALLQLWSQNYPASGRRIRLASLYFRWCYYFRKRFYVAVRIARRIAMQIFPIGWFPSQLRVR
jgi:glycosyltransferase involved in cell wall biosynthesis